MELPKESLTLKRRLIK